MVFRKGQIVSSPSKNAVARSDDPRARASEAATRPETLLDILRDIAATRVTSSS
jgi:hypothetical protein